MFRRHDGTFTSHSICYMTHVSRTVKSSPEHKESMVVSMCRNPASAPLWLAAAGDSGAGSSVQSDVWWLSAQKSVWSALCSSREERCFVAGSAHTVGGGRFVIWCETSGSGFSGDDTHSPLWTSWQTLNNTQETPGIADINILVWPGVEQGSYCRSDTSTLQRNCI